MPAHFALTESGNIADLVKAAALATLICHTPQGRRADHVPMVITAQRVIG